MKLGIDIGLIGGLSLLDCKKLIATKPIPTFEAMVGKKIRNRYDIAETYKIIKDWNEKYKIDKACMENLKPMQSSIASFSMGAGSMLFKTLLIVLEIPYSEIVPSKWQKDVFGELGIPYTGKTTKIASIQAAKQLFPQETFLRTKRSKKPCDGLTDSALIGYYLDKTEALTNNLKLLEPYKILKE